MTDVGWAFRRIGTSILWCTSCCAALIPVARMLHRYAIEHEVLGSVLSYSYHFLVVEECKSVCLVTCKWTSNNSPRFRKMKHSPLIAPFITQVLVSRKQNMESFYSVSAVSSKNSLLPLKGWAELKIGAIRYCLKIHFGYLKISFRVHVCSLLVSWYI